MISSPAYVGDCGRCEGVRQKAHPRSELERLASGEAIHELQLEIDAAREELERTREELAGYRCEYCNSPLASRVHAPADPEEKHWDVREVFECGHMTFGGFTERPCPSDPRFPKFSDYELRFYNNMKESHWTWECHAYGLTEMARMVYIDRGLGRSREEAEQAVRDCYERRAKRRNG